MKKLLICRIRKNDRGASLIEFALVLPLLIALVLGIIEFGWIFNGYVTLNGAVREGARIASIKRDLPSDPLYEGDDYIQAEVEKHATNTIGNLNADAERIIFQGNENNPQEWGVKVTATGTIKPLLGFYVTGDFPLSAETTMRVQ